MTATFASLDHIYYCPTNSYCLIKVRNFIYSPVKEMVQKGALRPSSLMEYKFSDLFLKVRIC